jgi:hypothetical protein
MKVNTYDTLEKAAIVVLKKSKKPLTAKNINNEIIKTHKVVNIRPTPKKLAPRLKKNPQIRTTKHSKQVLYSLFSV